MKHKGTAAIETQRLILRKITADDTEAAFRNWESDEKVTEFLCWTPMTMREVETVTNEWIERYSDEKFYLWVIVPKALGEPIGSISVVEMEEKAEKVQIAYCIGHKWWHQGYASEAFAAIIPFLFKEVGVCRIEAHHDPDNPNSGKVMAKCGLKYEGTLKKADWSNRGIVDSCIYGLTAEDYFQKL